MEKALKLDSKTAVLIDFAEMDDRTRRRYLYNVFRR